MRDIRPSGPPSNSSSPGHNLPEDVPESFLSEIRRRPKRPPTRRVPAASSLPALRLPPQPAPAPLPRTRLTGAKVPVSTVVVASPASIPANKKPGAALPASRMRLGYRERMIIVSLLGLLLVAGILAALIFLPRADIKLVLRTAPLLVDEELTIRASETKAAAVVAGSAFFREIEVQNEASVTSTEVVGKKARGIVNLVNRSTDTQKIKERSRLVTKDDVLFYLLKSATIPPTGTTAVEVEAAQAGELGNIAPQRLNFAALDASSQSLVYAQAVQNITGGSGETVAVVQDKDLAQAHQAAGEVARAQVEPEIRAELPKDWVMLEESWTSEVTSFATEATAGTRQPTIPYTARVVVRVIGYERAALEQHVKTALEQRLDKDYMLFPGPLSYVTAVQSVNWEASEAVISARVTHTTIPRFSLETLRQKLAGRSQKEAATYLEGLPGVRSVTMNLRPFWVQSIPRIENRIMLDLQPERQP